MLITYSELNLQMLSIQPQLHHPYTPLAPSCRGAAAWSLHRACMIAPHSLMCQNGAQNTSRPGATLSSGRRRG